MAALFNDENTSLPDLILLDLKLPKVDGIEILRQIREHPRTKLLVVVVLTTSIEESDIHKCYGLHVNSYLRKPVDFDQFLDEIKLLCAYWLKMNIAAPPTGRI